MDAIQDISIQPSPIPKYVLFIIAQYNVTLANIPFLTALHVLQAELTLLIVIVMSGIMNQVVIASHALLTNSTTQLKNCAVNVISTAKNAGQQAKLALIVTVSFFL